MINIEGTPRLWYEAPWDENTSFALADGEIQEELLDHIKNSNGTEPFEEICSETESELETIGGEQNAIFEQLHSLSEAVATMQEKMLLFDQRLNALPLALATVAPSCADAHVAVVTEKKSEVAHTDKKSEAAATGSKATTPFFEIFNISTWQAHLGHLSLYERRQFLSDQLMTDVGKFANFQKKYPFSNPWRWWNAHALPQIFGQ
eukprot:gene4766-biopygen3256